MTIRSVKTISLNSFYKGVYTAMFGEMIGGGFTNPDRIYFKFLTSLTWLTRQRIFRMIKKSPGRLDSKYYKFVFNSLPEIAKKFIQNQIISITSQQV